MLKEVLQEEINNLFIYRLKEKQKTLSIHKESKNFGERKRKVK